jgi:hypothetical protein
MRRRALSWYRHKNSKDRRERILQRSHKGVLAREAKRLENTVELKPHLVPFYPLQFGIREKATGDCGWIDFRSVRDASHRLAIIQRYLRAS